ncbi:MAG: T9SS type A sorting domain-containing protein, partial [Calditrichales bacterium]
GMTELTTVTEYVLLGEGKTVEPTLVTSVEIGTGGANAEAYEGVLVKVVDAVISTPSHGFGEWSIDDGSGPCRVDDAAKYYFNPADYEGVKHVIGPLNYAYGDTKILPRLAADVLESGDYTRIQYIQQVRHSDLIKTFTDHVSDISYFDGETFTIKGIVTMPSGLSYAGAGVKFILEEEGGGPWAGILSYNADSTAYPQLFEGDLIEMTGYIGEYSTGDANMTEFWITSPIQILDFGREIPAPNYVKTGDLRLPVTAEQWGNVMVYVKDATLVDDGPQFELFAVDDGSGSVLVDDDSDSLSISTYDVPPVGTIADSIRGWVYNHYGAHSTYNTYVLEPLGNSDIVWGAGPPAVDNVTRDLGAPTSSDAVTVSADVITNLTIGEVAVYYSVDGGAFTKVGMASTEGNTYAGQIPAQANGSFVNYFVVGSDNQDQSTISPSDTTKLNYSYPVVDGDLTISNIQYTPWSLADSPLEGQKVKVTGVTTVDTSSTKRYLAYSLQDAEAPWSGVFAFGIKPVLNRGDEVTIWGEVSDYNPDYLFKWGNNTVILVDSVRVESTGNSVAAIDVTTGELANDTTAAEALEGVLVKISNVTLQKVNPYDATFSDGTGDCLIDGDFMLARDQDPNNTFYMNDTDGYLVAFGDTIRPGDVVSSIQGIFTYSFGTFKIEVRDVNDFKGSTGINEDFKATPLSYQLKQNYPNPFNPETNINFEIAQAHDVKILIYNVLGQKVRTLVNENFNAGSHVVRWNGLSDTGFQVPSGVYFYRIKAGEFMASKKMVMLK